MNRSISYIYFLGAMVLIAPLSACAQQYSAEPIEAWVVDAETKQPIEGVIVTANWQLQSGNAGGSFHGGQLMVMETVTDKQGRFYFSGWGPLKPKQGYLINLDPQLLFFKSGYEYLRLNNTPFRENMHKDPVRKSDWNKKTIDMKRFKESLEEYAEHVHQLDNDLEWARFGDDCEWKNVHRMLLELQRMSEYFESKQVKLPGWRGGARIRKVTDVGNQAQCGSANEFFRSYLP